LWGRSGTHRRPTELGRHRRGSDSSDRIRGELRRCPAGIGPDYDPVVQHLRGRVAIPDPGRKPVALGPAQLVGQPSRNGRESESGDRVDRCTWGCALLWLNRLVENSTIGAG